MISGFFARLFSSSIFWLYGYCMRAKINHRHKNFLTAVLISIIFILTPYILGLTFTEYRQICAHFDNNCRMGNAVKITPLLGAIFGFLFYFPIYSKVLTHTNKNTDNQQ